MVSGLMPVVGIPLPLLSFGGTAMLSIMISFGLLLNGRFFFKKTGRFQSQISWVNAAEKNKLPYLPPEALNGYPVGISFRSNTRLQYFLNRSVSMIFTLNTIDDSRYDNFITFRGEIRAHF